MTEDSSREVWLRQARSYLRNADPVLARLIDDRPDFDLADARLDNPFGPAFSRLPGARRGGQSREVCDLGPGDRKGNVRHSRIAPHHALGPLTSFSDGR